MRSGSEGVLGSTKRREGIPALLAERHKALQRKKRLRKLTRNICTWDHGDNGPPALKRSYRHPEDG